ncbi:hypothetical protein BDY19DRAFT_562919 [Irpex rosettiformis]|uniref:Uncharacterized protein n=1 Tax=Irpex rosettiformis TaxID=378272 RepID=A0ACB8UC70_9APHY|nr:hypothetical protein BDY19DRAFT_562919 [Irpex rosettiformis]
MKGKISSQNKGHKGCSRKRCEKRRGKRSVEKVREKGPFLSTFFQTKNVAGYAV